MGGGKYKTPPEKKRWRLGMPGGCLPARPHLATVLGALISFNQLINALADYFYTQVVLFYR